MSLRRLSDSEDLPECIDIAEWAARSSDGCLWVGRVASAGHLRLESAAAPRMLSRSHCKMRLEGRELVLTDLGSTNGTFYCDGERAGRGGGAMEQGSAGEDDGLFDDEEGKPARAEANRPVRLRHGSTIYFGGAEVIELDEGGGGGGQGQQQRRVMNPAAYMFTAPPPAPPPASPAPGPACGGEEEVRTVEQPRMAVAAGGGAPGSGGRWHAVRRAVSFKRHVMHDCMVGACVALARIDWMPT
jgi:hypothetical protein